MAMGDRYYSVTLPRDNVIGYDVLMDLDERPEPYLYPKVRQWFQSYDLQPDWSFDDLGDVWFEFDNRGLAAIFLLTWA